MKGQARTLNHAQRYGIMYACPYASAPGVPICGSHAAQVQPRHISRNGICTRCGQRDVIVPALLILLLRCWQLSLLLLWPARVG